MCTHQELSRIQGVCKLTRMQLMLRKNKTKKQGFITVCISHQKCTQCSKSGRENFASSTAAHTKNNGKEKRSAKIRSTQNRNSQTEYAKSGREAFAKVQQLAATQKHQMDGEEEKV
jgi:hypothetical protein